MSTDEDAVEELAGAPVVVFKVKICPWRAPEIKDYLSTIDLAAGNAALGMYHARTTPRIASDQGSSTVKNGLPESMYDKEWLRRMRQTRPMWVEKELRVSKEAFTLLQQATAPVSI